MLRRNFRHTARHDLSALAHVLSKLFDIFVINMLNFIYAEKHTLGGSFPPFRGPSGTGSASALGSRLCLRLYLHSLPLCTVLLQKHPKGDIRILFALHRGNVHREVVVELRR